MLGFKEYLEEDVSVHAETDNTPQEQHTQNSIFGVQDYDPIYPKSSVKQVKESVEDHPTNDKRLIFRGDAHQGKAIGVSVPKHMWKGTKGTANSKPIMGMEERNKKRAEVYGSENRPPLLKKQIDTAHRSSLEAHFSKPKHEQIKAEKESADRLKRAGHLDSGSTLDKSEKTDTVNFERDHEKRAYTAVASKGVAGTALYTSGTGEHEKHHILTTCTGQTDGCGGGVDEHGVADTTKGSCFAPNAERQYPNAAIRRATHAQAKHDPKMTHDWIIAHAGSLRKKADSADRQNKRLLFRPNIVDETDTTSRHVIKHLNNQRKQETEKAQAHQAMHKGGKPAKVKPPIEGNGYGKTGDMHDPANGWHSTYSNTGPKVKHGKQIDQNVSRDGSRIKETVTASNKGVQATAKDTEGHHVNDDNEKTPPKGSYLVTNMHRGGDLDKEFQKHVTHAKYWSKGRDQKDLKPHEKAEGDEAHYDGEGNRTTEDKAHYGHKTINGTRYDYQKQHILHPRMVDVPVTKTSKKKDPVTGETVKVKTHSIHSIPTDSRFKDEDFLPKGAGRFKSKNGKDAGGILATTPTTSTDQAGHHSEFTHHVDRKTIDHAKANHGEYEIDNPHDQEHAKETGEKYTAPQAVLGGGKISVKKPEPKTPLKESHLVALRTKLNESFIESMKN